jgi:hypothetical protein
LPAVELARAFRTAATGLTGAGAGREVCSMAILDGEEAVLTYA